jgi:hypothetical protein
MQRSVAQTVSEAVPVVAGTIDLTDLQDELELVAAQAEAARAEGLRWDVAVRDARYGALARLHADLRDAMFVELPAPLRAWVEGQAHAPDPVAVGFGDRLAGLARATAHDGPSGLQRALAELLVFEAVRLRLLMAAWHSGDYERLGGDEDDVDAIAAEEIDRLLGHPALESDDVRPLTLLSAAATVSLAKDAGERAGALRRSGEDLREELSMRARLRAALRELRLPESILLANALATLLGEARQELPDLQAEHPLALEGMSRQAMDQRVSRGRRALIKGDDAWPRRRAPALYDLLRGS